MLIKRRPSARIRQMSLLSSIRALLDRTRELGIYEIDRPARWPRRHRCYTRVRCFWKGIVRNLAFLLGCAFHPPSGARGLIRD